MIYLKSLYKAYGPDSYALSDINLEISKGDFVIITGRSGAGKSTLLKLLYGEIKPTSGKILIGDIAVDKLSNNQLSIFRRNLGIIFQDFKLLNDRSVLENIFLPYYALNINIHGSRIKELMTEFDIWKYRDKNPTELSGGEQQKVAICRSLVVSPWVLIADEPTGNLDPKSSKEVFNIFTKISKQGTTVLLATHNENFVNMHKSRIITLEKGRLV
jgi:cell division transport system ATP-binding protein